MLERRSQLRGWTTDRLIVIDRKTDSAVGCIVNMSIEGLMLLSEEPLQISSPLECRVSLPEPLHDADQLYFDAVVKWCRESEVAGMTEVAMTEIGLRFSKIDEIGRKIIVSLLQNCTVAAISPHDVRALLS